MSRILPKNGSLLTKNKYRRPHTVNGEVIARVSGFDYRTGACSFVIEYLHTPNSLVSRTREVFPSKALFSIGTCNVFENEYDIYSDKYIRPTMFLDGYGSHLPTIIEGVPLYYLGGPLCFVLLQPIFEHS